jgi:hypothetical protein
MDVGGHYRVLALAMCLLVLGVVLLALSSRLQHRSVPPRALDLLVERAAPPRLRLLAVGTSNILWSTWVDQLAKELTTLGYSLDVGDGASTSEVSARCDDELVIPTLRVGRPGWYSWGFAFDDCQDVVSLAGIAVRCGDGWRCSRDEPATRIGPSRIAQLAKGADVLLLSMWQNDVWSRNACYNSSLHYEVLSVQAIEKLILEVSRENPRLLFLVMARYPYANRQRVSVSSQRENAYVRIGLLHLPRVYFVDYDFPPDEDFYFEDISGHPNCRGGRLMALAALKTLSEAGVVPLAVPPGAPDAPLYIKSKCSRLPLSLCRWSPMCFVDGDCRPYSQGQAPTTA